jgi:hypothetical protein
MMFPRYLATFAGPLEGKPVGMLTKKPMRTIGCARIQTRLGPPGDFARHARPDPWLTHCCLFERTGKAKK